MPQKNKFWFRDKPLLISSPAIRAWGIGHGACATVVAGVLTGKCDRTTAVELPGGVLQIEWSEVSQRIYMTGPAQRVFTGLISH